MIRLSLSLIALLTTHTLATTELLLTTPPDYSFTSSQSLTIRGYTPATTQMIQINSTQYPVASPSFHIDHPLSIGKNYLKIRAIGPDNTLLSQTIRHVISKQSFTDISDLPNEIKIQIEDLATMNHFPISTPEFKPNSPISRVELAQFLTATMRHNTIDTQQITDIPSHHPAYHAVNTAIQKNMMSLYEQNRFKPYRYVTRAEGIVSLLRFAAPLIHNPPVTKPYRDVPTTHWAATQIKTAQSLGWIPNSDTFNPDGYLTRADLVQITTKMPIFKFRINQHYQWQQ